MKQIQKLAADTCSVMDLTAVSAAKGTGRGEEFQKVMEQTAQPKEKIQTSTKSVEKEGASEEGPQVEILKKIFGSGQQKTVPKEVKMLPEEVLAVMQTLLADIYELFANVFQISEEELQGAMDAMGITDVDLLNPKVLTDLAVEVSPAEDVMGLLTDETMSDKLRVVLEESGQMKAEVFTAWNIEEPEMLVQAESFKNILQDKEIDGKEADTEGMIDKNKMPEEEKPRVIIEDTKTETESVQKEQSVLPKQNAGQNQLSQNQNEMKDNENHSEVQMNPAVTANTVLQAISEAVAATEADMEPEQIIRQLVEEIKVSVKADATSFEMQLNPEHLGKVNLQVVAKDGVVTAQLAAENQAVKEVLEAHVQILRENLQNQGVKVAAVEVTIASHGFEQNLDQQKQNQEQEQKQKAKRPFRYDVMDVEETELTSEELIEKEMMMAHGNRINYTA